MKALIAMLMVPLAAAANTAVANPDSPSGWTGIYGGVTTGGAELTLDGQWDSDDLTGPFELDSFGSTARTFQVHVGYNFHAPNNFIYGVEADIGRLYFTEEMMTNEPAPGGPDTWDIDTRGIGSIRLRAGYARGKYHFYGTAGWAWVSYELTGTDALSGVTTGFNQTIDGPVLGLGVEAQLSQHVRLRGELTRFEFNERTSLAGAADGSAGDFFEVDGITAFRISLSFNL